MENHIKVWEAELTKLKSTSSEFFHKKLSTDLKYLKSIHSGLVIFCNKWIEYRHSRPTSYTLIAVPGSSSQKTPSSSQNTPRIDQMPVDVQQVENEGDVSLGMGETIADMNFEVGLVPMNEDEVFGHFRKKNSKARVGSIRRGRGRGGGRRTDVKANLGQG